VFRQVRTYRTGRIDIGRHEREESVNMDEGRGVIKHGTVGVQVAI